MLVCELSMARSVTGMFQASAWVGVTTVSQSWDIASIWLRLRGSQSVPWAIG
jgi:hypothetical protein